MPGPPFTTKKDVWPSNVGIIAIEIYFPFQYVDQTELEAFDGASAGKYTIGLGQSEMGFCTDREDINSLCLTVVQRLVERQGILYADIGRLEVGTETIIDKSKSVKSVLMQLFADSDNTDVEGVDTTNACYGGTAALFNSINWIESSSWDGRYAVAVAADIAVYATGNARPTGGAGAVAMLIGPNAALRIERGMRGTHIQHAYDFYKPDLLSEYPVVDGKLSVECYLHALDRCYQRFRQKVNAGTESIGEKIPFTLQSADAFLFHTPYCKLVQKSLARLMLNDYLSDTKPDFDGLYAGLEKFRESTLADTYFDRDVEQAFMTASKTIFQQKTLPYLLIAKRVGNMYTPSLYGGLISYLISHSPADIANKSLVLFSYGSGLASSMYMLRMASDYSAGSVLDRLLRSLSDVRQRLDSRMKVEPAEFARIMKLREDTHHCAPYRPVATTEHLFPGTWYLVDIDDKHRRRYDRVPLSPAQSCINGS